MVEEICIHKEVEETGKEVVEIYTHSVQWVEEESSKGNHQQPPS